MEVSWVQIKRAPARDKLNRSDLQQVLCNNNRKKHIVPKDTVAHHLLPLHPSVLVPGLHLQLCEAEGLGQVQPAESQTKEKATLDSDTSEKLVEIFSHNRRCRDDKNLPRG